MKRVFAASMLALLIATALYSATSYSTSSTANDVIRDETSRSANTATRVGNALNGVLDAAIMETSAKSAAFTAVAGYIYVVDSSGGTIAVTAPSSASSGDIFGVVDLFGSWATNNVTVSFVNYSLHDQVTPNNSYIGDEDYANRKFRFDGTRWLIIQ